MTDKIRPGTTLSPYLRDYKSRKEIVVGMNGGHDLYAHFHTGQTLACSITDLEDGSHNVRYKNMSLVAVIKVKAGVAS